jgi:cytochrome c-type protein NapB
VIPHPPLGAACISCHNEHGVEVPDLGFAPPSPHEFTDGLSALSRCQQCHVFQAEVAPFAANDFAGLRQDLRPGERLYPGAPPVMPHPAFMRENCRACHTGPAARAEIVCNHPERLRCPQCHVEAVTAAVFAR